MQTERGKPKMFRMIIIAFAGLSSGGLVAAGTFAFITMIGIIPRLAARTRTASYMWWYENAVISGGTIGSIIYVFELKLKLWYPGVFLYALGAGVFVGCLAVALAEVIKTFPIFVMRTKLKWGIPYIALSLALGKMAGSLYGLIW